MDESVDGKGQSAEKSEETLSSEEDDAAVQEEIEEERPRRDKHKKKSYREKIRESMDDFEDEDDFDSEEDEDDYDDEPKKSRKALNGVTTALLGEKECEIAERLSVLYNPAASKSVLIVNNFHLRPSEIQIRDGAGGK